jgi:hypothetical protein
MLSFPYNLKTPLDIVDSDSRQTESLLKEKQYSFKRTNLALNLAAVKIIFHLHLLSRQRQDTI